MKSEKIRVVTATRLSKDQFGEKSLLAKSLRSYLPNNVELIAYVDNKTGLSEIYNLEIEKSKNDPCILMFVHDDVMLVDYFWPTRIIEGLEKYDVVGLAGNKKRTPYQPSWAHIGHDGENFIWDHDDNLSGTVAHGDSWPPEIVTTYGPSNQEVMLLDGVLLAAHSSKLIEKNIKFDPKFTFHFYDLDFSRTCSNNGLSLGTIELSVCHAGKGNMSSTDYRMMYDLYINKWESAI